MRLAYNWRSEEFAGRVGLNTNASPPISLGRWFEPVGYLDLQVNHWVNDHFSWFLSATNLTEENRRAYAQWDSQFAELYVQERRFTAGFSVRL